MSFFDGGRVCSNYVEGRMDGWFGAFSTVFQSYQDSGRVYMKGLCAMKRHLRSEIISPQADDNYLETHSNE